MTQAFNLSQLANNLNTSGQLDATDGLTGAVPVANGGTGLTSVGTSGNVLTSNGTAWVSSTPTGGDGAILNTQTFTASGTWTKPTGSQYSATDTVVAMYFGAGGSGGAIPFCRDNDGGSAGGGGGCIAFRTFSYSTIGSSLAVTIGAGGAGKASSNVTAFGRAGNTGGDTSFNGFMAKGGIGGNSAGTGGGESNVGLDSVFVTTALTSSDEGGYLPVFEGGRGRERGQGTTPRPNASGGGGGGSAFISQTTIYTNNNSAGISLFGIAGAGGNGNSNGNGSAGTAPSGGGGGASSLDGQCTSGAGARGEMRIYVVKGKANLPDFVGAL